LKTIVLGPLTKKQATKRRWNVRRREYKREWEKKNRPWRSQAMMLEIKKKDPIAYEKYLEIRKNHYKNYKRSEVAKEKNKIYCKAYRERRKALGLPARRGKSSYNPVAAKAMRRRHKQNKTNKWFSDNLRKVIHNVFRRRSSIEYKNLRSNELLGCEFKTAREHIESLFKPGMSWDNYGKWHMDHIIPCASFDLKCPIQQLACCHYKNLQPLWAVENMSKGDKIL